MSTISVSVGQSTFSNARLVGSVLISSASDTTIDETPLQFPAEFNCLTISNMSNGASPVRIVGIISATASPSTLDDPGTANGITEGASIDSDDAIATWDFDVIVSRDGESTRVLKLTERATFVTIRGYLSGAITGRIVVSAYRV